MNEDEERGNGFGPRFGLLIRSYRDDLGLSARDLAIRVWDDEGRKASISRLENGRVAQPAAKTVQAIAHALDIPQEEIDALRAPPVPDAAALAPHLESLSRASRDLLEALAARFEIERAFSYTDAQLRDLLELKAEEYRRYHSGSLSDGDALNHIAHHRSAAEEASQQLDFDACEAHLRKAEGELVVLSADLGEARARNALLRNRPGQAFELFEAAAEALRDTDLREMARRRDTYHNELSERGLRYGDEGLARAIRMQRPAIAALEATPWQDDRADYLKNLANSLAHLGARTDGPEGLAHIQEAVDAYREVLGHFTRDRDPRKWATTQQNLGGALYLMHQKSEEDADRHACLEGAVEAFRRALEVRDRAAYPYDWAVTMQNLGVALRDLGALSGGDAERRLVGQAITAFTDALSVRTREEYPFEWAMTCENLAHAEAALAKNETGPARKAHYGRAVAHIEAAIGIYERDNAPYFQEKAERFRDTLQNDAAG